MLFITGIITVFLVAALVSDVTRFIIPNWMVGVILALYPVALYLSPTPIDWQGGLMAFGVLFVAGFAMFALKIMGGGDVKLLAACGLWVGWSNLIEYIVYVAILGGILSIFLIVTRPICARLIEPRLAVPRLFRPKQPVPYGVAIAGALLIILWGTKTIPGI